MLTTTDRGWMPSPTPRPPLTDNDGVADLSVDVDGHTIRLPSGLHRVGTTTIGNNLDVDTNPARFRWPFKPVNRTRTRPQASHRR